MKTAIRKGLGFGLTSGIITTLGLIFGLNSGTHSKIVIIGAILVIAIADSFSDSLGIHISEEAGSKTTTRKELWESMFATFFFKFFITITFIIPIWFLELQTAIIVCAVWGLTLLGVFSYYLAKRNGTKPHKVILEHLTITIIVIIVTHLVGRWAGNLS